MGCSRKCAHATKARMGNKKNGRTWGEISVNVQLSGQPKRRKRSARVWRTVQAHGSGARMWPCVRTVAPVQEWGKYEGRAAGYSADGMRRLERATVPKGQTATNQQRVVGLRKKLRLSNVIRAFKSYLCCLGKLSQQTSTKLCYRAEWEGRSQTVLLISIYMFCPPLRCAPSNNNALTRCQNHFMWALNRNIKPLAYHKRQCGSQWILGPPCSEEHGVTWRGL